MNQEELYEVDGAFQDAVNLILIHSGLIHKLRSAEIDDLCKQWAIELRVQTEKRIDDEFTKREAEAA